MKSSILQKNKLDLDEIRNNFPILQKRVYGKELVYLDNAATTQKPIQVIEAISNYYRNYNGNVHRGNHYLSDKATVAYEEARRVVANFINAESFEEINFVRGTTEGINLVAHSFGKGFVKAGDEIIISQTEHHSNIVPWQMLCEENKAKLRIIPTNDEGEWDLEEFRNLLSPKTKVVAVQHVSNALGKIQPIKDLIEATHKTKAKILIDGAQAIPHMRVDVRELDCDFYCFSSHKMFGPTGIGVLYGKREILEEMPPYQGGGEMISEVTFEKTIYNELPYKFEAGTPNIAGAIGLRAAIDFMKIAGYDNIREHEENLCSAVSEKLSQIDGLTIYGNVSDKVPVVSFLVESVHPFDLGVLLDKQGIAIRTGHHCCQPLMKRFNIEGTCRASFAFYNTLEEVDKLYDAIKSCIKILR